MSRMIAVFLLALLTSGCDPLVPLVLRPESNTHRPLSKGRVHSEGGFEMDTLGVRLEVHAVLWGATRSSLSSELLVSFTFTTETEFRFALIRSVLEDQSGWKRRPFGVWSGTDRIMPDQLFAAHEEHQLVLGINDHVPIQFPARMILPPVVFTHTNDTLLLSDLVIEGVTPER